MHCAKSSRLSRPLLPPNNRRQLHRAREGGTVLLHPAQTGRRDEKQGVERPPRRCLSQQKMAVERDLRARVSS